MDAAGEASHLEDNAVSTGEPIREGEEEEEEEEEQQQQQEESNVPVINLFDDLVSVSDESEDELATLDSGADEGRRSRRISKATSEESEGEWYGGVKVYVSLSPVRRRWRLAIGRVVEKLDATSSALREMAKTAQATNKIDAGGMNLEAAHRLLFSYNGLRILLLQNNHLRSLPPSLGKLRLLQQLRLANNELLFIPSELGKLTALQSLWVQNNQLKTLPDSISNCTNLVSLYMAGNPMTWLPIGMGRCAKIKEMTLADETLHFPPPEIVSRGWEQVLRFLYRCENARRTKQLDISNLGLKVLSSEMAELTMLRTLKVQKNSITNIPTAFGYLTNLTDLHFDLDKVTSPPMDVSRSGVSAVLSYLRYLSLGAESKDLSLNGFNLTAMPDFSSDMQELQRLHLRDNKLTTLPLFLNSDRFPRLFELDVDGNQIAMIPPHIFKMPLKILSAERNNMPRLNPNISLCVHLEELRLRKNLLQNIPFQIASLDRLETLLLSDNLLESLPTSLGKLSRLQRLSLERNKLAEIPVELGLLTQMQELNLSITENEMELPPMEIIHSHRSIAFLGCFSSMDPTTLSLIGFNLTAVPSPLSRMSSLTFLSLAGNRLTGLPLDMESLSVLTSLDLSRNRFKNVPSVIIKFVNLKELNLDSNLLNVLPSSLVALANLQKLSVEGNDLHQPPLDVVRRGINAVKMFLAAVHNAPWSNALVLSGHKLRHFPTAAIQLQIVRELDLSNNYIGNIPKEISVIVGLSILNLSYNQIELLPPSIGEMRDLKILALQSNRLKDIPDTIGYARKLRRLFLNNNQIQSLPSTVGLLTKMLELCLTNNELEQLPSEVGQMTQLQQLQLSYNRLKAIPKSIGKLTNLTELAVMNNQLTALPHAIGKLTSIEKFAYRSNPYDQPPAEVVEAGVSSVLRYIRQLYLARKSKQIDLREFLLARFPPELLFFDRAFISELILDDNRIKVAPPALTVLSSLTLLSLSRNLLKTVPSEWCKLTNLTALHLDENHLRNVPLELGLLPSMVRLQLGGNIKLKTPPRELLLQSTECIIKYLKSALEAGTTGILDWEGMQLSSMMCIRNDVASWRQLKELRMDRNKIVRIEAELCAEMPLLEVLLLGRNEIQDVPPEIGLLTSLRTLSLVQNCLDRLPYTVGHLTRLEMCDVRANKLVSPPGEVLQAGRDVMLNYLARMQEGALTGECTLSFCQLIVVPQDALDLLQLRSLNLDDNRIRVLSPMLTVLTMLSTLSVCRNRLINLPSFLAALPNLSILRFNDNNINTVPPELGSFDTQLQELGFSGNPIIKPPASVMATTLQDITRYLAHVLASRKSLSLKLHDFEMVSTAPEIVNLPNLVSLRLTKDRIRSIDDAVFSLSCLAKLDLSDNQLEELPVDIERLSRLTELRIAKNALSSLPDSVGTLQHLEVMDVSENRIYRVTEALSKCTKLVCLLLDSNQIEELPPELALLPNLQEFGFLDNPLRSPPSYIFSQGAGVVLRYLERVLVGLEAGVVNLGDFAFTQVPELVLRFTNLTELHLDHNELGSVPAEIGTLVNLKNVLALNCNRITSMPVTISRLDHLVELRLEDNVLTTLPPALVRMTSLEKLLLDRNHLESLPGGIGSMPRLHELTLSDNFLHELPADMGLTTSLRHLTVQRNPLYLPPPQIITQGIRAILKFLSVMMGLHEKKMLDFRDMALDTMSLELLARQGVETILLSSNCLIRLDDAEESTEHDMFEDVTKALEEALAAEQQQAQLHHDMTAFASNDQGGEGGGGDGEDEGDENGDGEERSHNNDDNNGEENGEGATTKRLLSSRLSAKSGRMSAGSRAMSRLESANASRQQSRESSAMPNHRQLSEKDALRMVSAFGDRGSVTSGSGGGGGVGGKLSRASSSIGGGGGGTTSRLSSAAQSGSIRWLMSALGRRSAMRPKADMARRAVAQIGKVENLRMLKALVLDHNQLKELPPLLTQLVGLRVLSVCDNKLERLPEGMNSLSSLTTLSLSRNCLKWLPLELGVLPLLSFLDTDDNPLVMPPTEVTQQGMSMIRKYLERLWRAKNETFALDLGGFGLRHLPDEVILLTGLKSLSIPNSQLEDVPRGIIMLTNLTELALGGNKITELEPALFRRLVLLERLILSRNQITSLPTTVGFLQSLTELRLNDNPITHFPLEIGHLRHLSLLMVDIHSFVSPPPTVMGRGAQVVVQYLLRLANSTKTRIVDMRSMGLAAFPPEVLLLTSITLLRLDQNHLTQLPAGISKLTDLTELTLANNNLETLPVELGALSFLKTLQIDHSRAMINPPYEIVAQGMQVVIAYMRNMRDCRFTGLLDISDMRMTSLPGHLLLVPGLKELRAMGNQFMELPPELGQMAVIERLYLQNNQLRNVPREVMSLSAKLVHLRLGNNSISQLPIELAQCSSLQILSVQNNLLDEFPLNNMPSLRKLNLSANAITSLPPDWGNFPALAKCRLDRNQLMELPTNMCHMTSLTLLSVSCNMLSTLPRELSSCTNVTALHLGANQIGSVPVCILSMLKMRLLWLTDNHLLSIPFQLADLKDLYELQVEGNPDLSFPPRSIVVQGTENVLKFLGDNLAFDRDQDGNKKQQLQKKKSSQLSLSFNSMEGENNNKQQQRQSPTSRPSSTSGTSSVISSSMNGKGVVEDEGEGEIN